MRTEIPIVILNPSTGVPVPNASVNIVIRGTTTQAAVYAVESAGATLSQPLISDIQGRVQGWIERGAYEATISPPGFPQYVEPFESSPGADGGIDSAWIASNAVTTPKMAGFGSPVTSLPASPIDGQICFFQSTAMGTSGTIWMLRYRSGASGSYKWEFVGGSMLGADQDAAETFNSFAASTWGGVSSNDPTVTVPLAGDYAVLNQAMISVSAGVASLAVGLKVNSTLPTTSNSANGYASTATANQTLTHNKKQTFAASDVLLQMYWHNAAGTNNLTRGRARLAILPIRVG